MSRLSMSTWNMSKSHPGPRRQNRPPSSNCCRSARAWCQAEVAGAVVDPELVGILEIVGDMKSWSPSRSTSSKRTARPKLSGSDGSAPVLIAEAVQVKGNRQRLAPSLM